MAQSKRATTFPGRLAGQQSPPTKQPVLELSEQNIPDPLSTFQKRQTPPRLPLNVNPKSGLFTPSSVKSANNILVKKESPWRKYHGFLKVDQAGPGVIAYEKCAAFPTVIIKEKQHKDLKLLEQIKGVSHDNIVRMQDVFIDGPSLYVVYDCMSVSLKDVQSSPCADFADFEIAAICKEVLQGVIYIHNKLNMGHGGISSDHILLSREGAVKIANIGEAVIFPSRNLSKQKDVRAIGLVMMELMEPGTVLDTSKSIRLERPELWTKEARGFLKRTFDSTTADTLLKDVFLEFSPGPGCLVPHIWIAELSVKRNWEIFIA